MAENFFAQRLKAVENELAALWEEARALRARIARTTSHTHGTYCRWRGSSTGTPSSPQENDVWNDTTGGGNVVKIYANGGWRALN